MTCRKKFNIVTLILVITFFGIGVYFPLLSTKTRVYEEFRTNEVPNEKFKKYFS